ncbi:MAG: restriction endonuclease subunit S, partial [Eubacteriales bacterium]|nr:restriction endonuclease subunit S [Eubacteriales bacterium]
MSRIKLSEIGIFKNGLNFSAENVNSGCKMIGIPDFEDNYIAKLQNLKEINPDIVSDDYLLQDNDILFVRSNGNKKLVGRTMIVKDINEKVTFSGFCIRFRITNANVNPLYMLYLFKSPIFRKMFSNTQQTSINNLNQDILGNIEFDLPTLEKQVSIVSIIHNITLLIENNNKINDNL